MNTSTTSDKRTGMTKGERTRARLIDAARDRFGRLPYAEVSVSGITRDVGLTPAASYAYFADKEALFSAALDAELGDWISGALPAATGDRPLVGLFVELIAGLDRHPLAGRVMREGDADQLQQVLHSAPMQRFGEEIEATIRLRQESGATRSDVPAATLAIGAQTIAFSLFTTIVRTGLLGDPERLEGIVALMQAALGSTDGPMPDFDHTVAG